MRRLRFRKWTKWACTLAAGLAIGLAAFSRFYAVRWSGTRPDGAGAWMVLMRSGLLGLASEDEVWIETPSRFGSWIVWRAPAWRWGSAAEQNIFGTASDWRAGICWGRDSAGWRVGASIIYPVILTTIPAALLWYADRHRFGPSCCAKCGYDRRGLRAEVRCPECGTSTLIA